MAGLAVAVTLLDLEHTATWLFLVVLAAGAGLAWWTIVDWLLGYSRCGLFLSPEERRRR